MKPWSTRLVLWGALVTLAVAGTGCLLSLMRGYMVLSDVDADTTKSIVLFEGEAAGATCIVDGDEVDCLYTMNGDIASNAALVGTLGLVGVFVDPVILQIPSAYVIGDATFDHGNGPEPLVVRSGLASVPVAAGVALTPEAGQQLVVIELPDAFAATLPSGDPENGTPFSFAIEMSADHPRGTAPTSLAVKAIMALEVTVGGETFYPPMLPCVTSFADVPAVMLQALGSFQDLLPGIATALAAAPAQGCTGRVYDFDGSPATTSTTTSTLPSSAETCDNCRDDDADGRVDYEDDDCCGTSSALDVRRARFKASGDATRLALGTAAAGLGLRAPLTATDVVLQLRAEPEGVPFCAIVAAAHLRARKKSLAFEDAGGTVAGGLSRLRIRVRADGSTRIAARGTRARFATPPPGPLRLTVALPRAAGGPRCAGATIALRRKNATIRYP